MSSLVRRRRALVLGVFLVPVVWWAVAAVGDAAPPSATRSVTGIPVETPGPNGDFARGTCVAFPPLDGEARATVFLDAGHGGPDPGALGRTSSGRYVHEKVLTLAIVKATTAKLRAAGYKVVVSRWTDTSMLVLQKGDLNGRLFSPAGAHRDLLARVACANDAKADVLLSVHLNAFGDPREGGSMTLYDPSRSFTAKNRALGDIVHGRIRAAYKNAVLKIVDRFVISDTSFGGGALTKEGAEYGHDTIIGPRWRNYVPEASAMPGIILEPLFITRPAEADVASSPQGQALLADAITAGVEQWFSRRR